MVRKLVGLSLGALALAACGDATTAPVRADDVVAVPITPVFHHTPAPVIGAVIVDADANTVSMNWVAGTGSNPVMAGGYVVAIDRCTASDCTTFVNVLTTNVGSSTTYLSPQLSAAHYRISVNSHYRADQPGVRGDGSWSIWTNFEIVQSGPPPRQTPTVEFEGVPAKTFGDAPFTVTAVARFGGTATGQAISYALGAGSAGCTLSGNEVTITGATVAGSPCIVTAAAAATSEYEAAGASLAIAIAKASQTISFDLSGVTATYGDDPFTISALGGASGNPVTFASQTSDRCTVSGNDVTIVGAGLCTIRASQAGNDNYLDADDVDQSVTIATAPLTITVVDADGVPYAKSIYFSDAVPAATLEISGLVYDDVASDIGDPSVQWCKMNGACTDIVGTPTAVGSYAAYPAPVTTTNYHLIENRGSLTIQAWTLQGFFRPVDMDGVVNSVKGGSTVPLKFEIFKGTEELTLTGTIRSFTTTTIACSNGTLEDAIPTELLTTGGTSLRYDSVAGQFIQNWQTPKSPGKCYRVTMTTQDGSTLQALFRLK